MRVFEIETKMMQACAAPTILWTDSLGNRGDRESRADVCLRAMLVESVVKRRDITRGGLDLV